MATALPLLLYALWLLMRCFIADYFSIPTYSMVPTLLPGDRVLVDKTEYGARLYTNFQFEKGGIDLCCFRTRGTSQIKRNDVVVFNMPNNGWKIKFVINYVFCKRCIAISGDTISAINGHYVNNNFKGVLGVTGEQDRLSVTPDSLLLDALYVFPYDHIWTIKNFGPIYIPRKGDVIRIRPKEGCLYRIALEWELGKHIAVDWEKNEVTADGKPLTTHRFKHNYYFMAGDNVSDSNDSRYWGLVPEEYIIGRVCRIIYSEDKETKEIRWHRILKTI